MPRKRNEWGPKGDQIFADMTRRGLPAGEIAAAMKVAGVSGASKATVERRQRETVGPRRNSAHALESAAAPTSRPAVLDTVPEAAEELEAASLGDLDWWLAEVYAAALVAKGTKDDEGNVVGCNPAVLASLAARATALLEAKRKASPPVFVDPNDAFDIREAAAKGRALFFETLENIIANRGLQ